MSRGSLTVTLLLAGVALSLPAAPALGRSGHSHHRSSKSIGTSTAPTHAKPAPPGVPAVCPDTSLQPTSANLGQVTAATLCLINQQRVAAGLTALAENQSLAQAAGAQSQAMVTQNFFGHVDPDGSTVTVRLHQSGYITAGVGYEIGENIAWGSLEDGTPAAIVSAWMQSAEHRANILDAAYTETGLGVVASIPAVAGVTQPGATYTQDFGVIQHG
jgi:uncharacterized protein YkwD